MQTTKKEISKFVIAGLFAVSTDSLVYWGLLNFLTPTPAKTLSFVSGTLLAFIINKYWTFDKKERSYSEIYKFTSLYMISLAVNIIINKLSLFITPTGLFLAFLAATSASAVINFIGQKWWVFKK